MLGKLHIIASSISRLVAFLKWYIAITTNAQCKRFVSQYQMQAHADGVAALFHATKDFVGTHSS